jgi:hypothetical protein
MTEPLSQVEIEIEMNARLQRSEKVTHAVKQRGEEAAEADTEYDVAYSKAFVRFKESEERCSDELAKAKAKLECADLLGRKNTTKALIKAAEEAGRNCREEQETLRSLNANHRPLVTG